MSERRPLIEVFWKRVAKRGPDECWPWTGTQRGKRARLGNGYGSIHHLSKQISAHRVSYELFVGPISKGLHVLHRCDNPPCCNPAHLFLGSNADNMADMSRKGRGRSHCQKGESNNHSKLTVADVREIRATNAPSRLVASLWGISARQFRRVRRGEHWRGVQQ